MKKKIVICYLICLSTSAFSWGSKGHKIVSEIAKLCLEKSVQDSIQFYLGEMTFSEASVWMDEIRSNQEYDYMKPWHYVNVDKDKTYVKVDNPNVINQIESAIGILKEKKKERKRINDALKVLFHLVGDLHQPLHCGYSSDKGGNTLEVDFLGKNTNLHHVWDTDLIDASNITLNDCLKLSNSMTKEEKNEISKIDLDSWVKESRSLLPGVYSIKNGKIDQEYIDRNKLNVEKQLLKAGIRLASILHTYFKN